jgi:predicted branched-subunit amino acid permease
MTPLSKMIKKAGKAIDIITDIPILGTAISIALFFGFAYIFLWTVQGVVGPLVGHLTANLNKDVLIFYLSVVIVILVILLKKKKKDGD